MNQAEIEAKLLLTKLGIFRALFKSGGLFINIIFRLMVGYVGGLPLNALAVVHAAEFGTATFLEIPAGFFADRFGRLRSAIGGYFLMAVAMGLVFVFAELAWVFSSSGTALLILIGCLVGIGVSLISGSVDGFYQNRLQELSSKHPQVKDLEKNSFMLSAAFGKYLPFWVLVGAFASAYVLRPWSKVHYSFILASMIFFTIGLLLRTDLQKYGDDYATISRNDLSRQLRVFISSQALHAVFLNALGYFLLVVASYFLVALGREPNLAGEANKVWGVLFAYTFGQAALGWWLQGQVLPALSRRVPSQKHLIFTVYGLLGLVCALIWALVSFVFSFYVLIGALVVLGALLTLVANALQYLARNQITEISEAKHYASSLSILNIPGMLSAVVFFVWVSRYHQGSLDMVGYAWFCSLALLVSCVTSAMYYACFAQSQKP